MVSNNPKIGLKIKNNLKLKILQMSEVLSQEILR